MVDRKFLGYIESEKSYTIKGSHLNVLLMCARSLKVAVPDSGAAKNIINAVQETIEWALEEEEINGG